MKINFLGTAAAEGWPALFCECKHCRKARKLGGKDMRRRTMTLIDNNILIDFGPDALSYVHCYNINLLELDAIIITHSHSDHFCIEELRMASKPFAHYDSGSRLNIYGNETIVGLFDANIKSNNLLKIKSAVPFEPFTVGEYRIHPLTALHGADSETCLIYAIEKDGKAFFNGNDTNYFPEETWEYIKKLKFDAVALDTTLGKGSAPGRGKPGHMNVQTVIEVKKRMLEIGCANGETKFFMNHFSHNGGLLHRELEQLSARSGFTPAYDGMTIEI